MSLISKSSLAVCVLVTLVFMLFGTGCVTQTERVAYRPYAPPPKDESVWEEIQREFGWEQSSSGEPLYKRTTRGIKEIVAGWFSEEEDTSGKGYDWDEARRQYEIRRQHAIQRVRQQNTLEGRIEIRQ
jgi:hypothetical protein